MILLQSRYLSDPFPSDIDFKNKIILNYSLLNLRWCVFWDLYCAAPERREQNEHSSEAKAFHDYSANVHQNNAQTQMHPTDPQHANPQFNPYFQVSRSFLSL